jgi:TonB family protein
MRRRDHNSSEDAVRNSVDQGAGRRLLGAWLASAIAHAAFIAAVGMLGRLPPPPLPRQPNAISIERILLEPAAATTARPATIPAASVVKRTPDRRLFRAAASEKMRSRSPLAASEVAVTLPPPAVAPVPPTAPESPEAGDVPAPGKAAAAVAAAFANEDSVPVARDLSAQSWGGEGGLPGGRAARGPLVAPGTGLVGDGSGPYGPVKPPAAPVPEIPATPGPTRDAEPSSLSMPAIPDSLKGAPYRSFVRVRVAVSAEGESEITLSDSSGNPEIDQHVIDAMRLWRWKPALRDGRPVASVHHFKFDFAVN